MPDVQRHYETLLAPVYLWMAGGADAALKNGAADVAAFLSSRPGFAVDLGAGFGMHSIPLARAGWSVLAIDTSSLLVEQLRSLAPGLSISTRVGDLLSVEQHVAPHAANLVLCMGDTLTHLPSEESVELLAQSVARILHANGRFAATFRDYSKLPQGDSRFIPVRGDANRVHTCYLEEAGTHVRVHDILHELVEGQWSMKVSSYPKLRVAPERVADLFRSAGLAAQVTPGPRGMVQVTAHA